MKALRSKTTSKFWALPVAAVAAWSAVSADAQLRIVTYNTNTFGTEGDVPGLPANFRTVRSEADIVFQAIGEEEVNGIARPADIILLQEQQQLDTTTQNLVDRLNAIYAGTGITYARGFEIGNTTGSTGLGTPSGGEIRQGVIYRTDSVELIEEDSFGSISGFNQPRETLFHRFRPVGFGSEADLFIFNSHFEAGDGLGAGSDLFARENEATDIRNFISANGLGDSNIIVAGDLNVDSNFETSGVATFGGRSSLQILSDGTDASGRVLDPLFPDGQNVTFNNNFLIPEILTQSPSDGGGGLVGGGIDDRFDFILTSDELLDDGGVALIEGSHRAFGNNGSTFNDQINDGNTIQIEGLASFTTAQVLDALEAASDHLPVVSDFQLPAIQQITRQSPTESSAPLVAIQGADVSLEYLIENVSPVENPLGADELSFSFSGNGLNIASGSGEVLVGEPETVQVALDTQEIGLQVGEVLFETNGQGIGGGSFSDNLALAIVGGAVPSFDALDPEQQVLEIDLGRIVLSEDPLVTEVSVFNPLLNPLQAALSIVGAEELGSDLFSFVGTNFDEISPDGSGELLFELQADTLGEALTLVQIQTADSDTVLGAQSREPLSLALRVAVAGSLADLDLDGDVDVVDLDLFGTSLLSGGADLLGDLNGDGTVGVVDLDLFGTDLLAANAGQLLEDRSGRIAAFGDSRLSALVIPEPGALALMSLGSLAVLGRRRKA